MAQAPRAADLLIKGAHVVTFDGEDTVVPDGAIAIAGNAIVWIYAAAESDRIFSAPESIAGSGQIALPGLIDTHYHTGQRLLRGKLAAIHRKGPQASFGACRLGLLQSRTTVSCWGRSSP